jgi:RNA polymerase sigma factor (TIGR02999 family)
VQPDQGDITQLLRHAAEGDHTARERLYAALYAELMRLARIQRARAGTISLDAPAILHESFLRFGGHGNQASFLNRKAFFGYASTVMRSVIVDYVRERKAKKRGGGEPELTLDTGVATAVFRENRIEALNDALLALERIDARGYRVVEMRYFGGLSEEEVAEVLSISVPTVKRDWRRARAFLFDHLGG